VNASIWTDFSAAFVYFSVKIIARGGWCWHESYPMVINTQTQICILVHAKMCIYHNSHQTCQPCIYTAADIQSGAEAKLSDLGDHPQAP